MPKLHWYHAPGYDYGRYLPLPRRIHGFVRNKPSLIKRALVRDGVVRERAFQRPVAVSRATLEAVHDAAHIAALEQPRAVAQAAELALLGYLPRALVRHALVAPQLLAAGGTCAALVRAAAGDWACNLSGGFHHARPDLAHGFCLVNDVAMAVHELHARGSRPRILVLDLDLHQGDGNAAAFAGQDDVFTASMHQESAFPVPKLASDRDIGLADGTGDDGYLAALDGLLEELAPRGFEVVIYVAGTDPFVDDAIGSLTLSRRGLVERDRRVARFARQLGAGLVVVPAGGYSEASAEISAAGVAAIATVAAAPAP